MDDNEVESIRRDIGEKMARDKTDVLSPDASDSVKEGYRRGLMNFGSNVVPKNFGKGRFGAKDFVAWNCICGFENSSSIVKKVGKRIVCWQCGVDKELALLAQKTETK